MEDLQDKIIELMDLFDGEVTTADKIERPQKALDKQAIDDFMDRNPMAGGGMLVQPSSDGSRPGYSGKAVEPNIRLSSTGNAYDVTIKRGEKTFYKTFRKDDYENAKDALNAAKNFRDEKKKIPFKVGIQNPQIVASSREEYNEKYRESKGLKDPTGKIKKAKERETKIKNFIGDKKKIKASVLRDFMLNEVGYKNYDAADVKKYFPNLEIEQDNIGGSKEPRMDKKRLNIANRYANLLNKKGVNDPYYVSSKNYADLPKNEKQRITQIMRQNDGKFKKDFSSRLRFDSKKEKLIMESFGLTENDFIEHGRTGVPQRIDGKLNPKYTAINKFINKGFKFDKIKKSAMVTLDQQEFIKNNFELPEGKDWNFKSQDNPNGYKYGVAGTKDSGTTNLAKRIENRMSNKNLSYTVAADTTSPKGWMMNAMNRLYEREIEAEVKPKDLTYKPKFDKKGIIIGFTDATAAGGNKTYYGLNKNTPEDATAWTAHGDHERIKKFLNIAKGAQIDDPSKLLQKILDDKGITKLMGDKSVLTLNDILSHERYYTKLSDVVPKKLLERQIVLHHSNRIGSKDLARAAATQDIQLLTGAVNNKVRKLETIASKRKLNADELTKLKNLGVRIQDFDGKVVGGGFTDPTKQFAAIEKKALEYAKGDQFNVKTVASYLERLGCGKAAGGRVFYNEGAFGLTKCAEKGRLKLENIVTKGASNADDAILAKSILKAGGGLKSAFALRNIFGPAAIAATVAFEGGLIGYDMLTSGKTLREAFGDNLLNYALGKDYQIDPQEELFKRFKGLGYDDQQIGGIKKALDAMNTINTGTQLAMDVGQQQEALQKSRGQPEPFMGPDDQMMTDTAGQRAEQNLKDAQERLTAFNQSLEAVDRPGGMKKEDVLSEYFSSGKYAGDLDLFNQAEKEANIQKLESAGPKFMGSVFPKFEEKRQTGINENLGVLVNPAFNIPGARDATFIPGKTTGGLFGLAGGGIAKMAGDRSGSPPESGPNPQGLQGLMKRVKNI